MVKIRKNLKVAQDRQKSYVDKRRTHREFKVGEHMFLKVKAKKISLKFKIFPKLAVRYCGPFEVLEKIGLVSYMLALPVCMRIHNVIHVYLLKKYVPDPNDVIDWNLIQVEHKKDFWVELVLILDRKVKVRKNITIGLVKVQWTCYGPEDAT
jgi:hypothetical protein